MGLVLVGPYFSKKSKTKILKEKNVDFQTRQSYLTSYFTNPENKLVFLKQLVLKS